MRKINIKPETKKQLTIFSAFFGIIFGLTAILVVSTLLSRSSWKEGLSREVQSVLDSYSPNEYSVGEYLPVNSSFSTSAAVYSVHKSGHGSAKNYAVIARIPSILGPLPAVFIYDDGGNVFFAGYAVDNGKAEKTVSVTLSRSVMNYWEKLVPELVGKTGKLEKK